MHVISKGDRCSRGAGWLMFKEVMTDSFLEATQSESARNTKSSK